MADLTYSDKAIHDVLKGRLAFCKILASNDTGKTGGHQSGVYMPKTATRIMFAEPGRKGENKKKNIRICWQDDFSTDGVFTYYGKGTRNEYRVTHFGHGFDLLNPENTGSLFVLVQMDEADYRAYVLTTEDEIDAFLDYFGMTQIDTNTLIEHRMTMDELQQQEMDAFIAKVHAQFPQAEVMSTVTRQIFEKVYDHKENIVKLPDKELTGWIRMEFDLFSRMEEAAYGELVYKGFSSMEEFVKTANSILNRRKSRAGKSLENHLAAIFDGNQLTYEAQVVTELRKRPDFVFPGGMAYHDLKWPAEKLIVMGAKTTCKDRWRQVLSEAARVKEKYLFTLQQAISSQQLAEMQSEEVRLVVPREYIGHYPREYQESILSLAEFIGMVKEKTA